MEQAPKREVAFSEKKRSFEDLHDDNWDGIVRAGVGLLNSEEIKEDTEFRNQVIKTLQDLKNRLTYSEAGSEVERKKLISDINSILKPLL